MPDYDVIVAGFGFAGGVAAIAAHDAGARVAVLEKGGFAGGISICSAGGLRITNDASAALGYLLASNAGTTPEPVMRTLAEGMADLPRMAETLCEAAGARLGLRSSPANYPLPGYESFGFAYVEDLPGFDPAAAFPLVRGSLAGARLFEVVRRNVASRSGIDVRLSTPVERLLMENGTARGVIAGGERIMAGRAVILACGGFESDPELQRQFWPVQPVLSAAVRGNTGDGLRMGQAAGASLWHM
jgi:succinate dehydrogenase/fumarate reductase flavoprotein subunit